MVKKLTEPPLPEGQRLLSDELNELGYLRANKEKYNIEFNRYKQDCRKRALEVSQFLVSQVKGGIVSEDILKEADKYYKWLISIPEK